MIKGSLDIGKYIGLTCASGLFDSVGDSRQYSDENGYIIYERCTVANAVKWGGTWEPYAYEPEITYPTENPEVKFYRGDKTFSEITIGSGGYAAHLYATTINSDISSYKKADYSVEATETEISTTLSNSTVLVEEYLFDSHIGVTTIQNGVWRFMCYCKIGAVNHQGAKIRFEVFLRHTDNTETVLFTKDSSIFTNTAYPSEIIPIEYSGTVYSCVTTDRLGYKVYIITTSISSLTATYIVGDGRGLYMDTPLSLGHDQLRRFNIDRKYQHLDSETTLSDAIDETNDKIGFWDNSILKFIMVSFATLKSYFKTYFDTIYQAILVSGTNIKTINNESILGSGNLTVSGGSGTSLWTAITGTRASNTTITVAGDQTAIFKKGMIVRWLESSVIKWGMVSISSTYSSPNTTITIIGCTCASIDTDSFKYSSIIGVEQFIERFAIAGTIGATGTNVAREYYATEPMYVIGADLQVGTAGTTNSTTIDINLGGNTMFTVKPTLATTVAASTTPFTADTAKSLALNDKVTIDIDAVQTTPAVNLYVQLYVVPQRYFTLT